MMTFRVLLTGFHCTFLYIEGKAVLNVKITIKWGENQGKNRDGW